MWAWRAWLRLRDDRQWRGGGTGPDMPCGIHYSTVAGYADRHDLNADSLFNLIRSLDGLYLDWWADEVRRASARG